MSKRTTDPGYVNRNNQKVIRNTGMQGTDHNQVVYELECLDCGKRHGANVNGVPPFDPRGAAVSLPSDPERSAFGVRRSLKSASERRMQRGEAAPANAISDRLSMCCELSVSEFEAVMIQHDIVQHRLALPHKDVTAAVEVR